jgi:hypothetical protein
MPQGPFQTQVLSNATHSRLNITANTVVKASNGNVATLIVLGAGSANGGLFDAATVSAAVAGTEIFAIPQVAGVYQINFPIANGIVVKPGTGQTIAISYT